MSEQGIGRFRRLVTSNAGLRFAHAKAEYGVEIPCLSDDPFEQWLVEEALMTAYHERRHREEQLVQAHASARQEAQSRIRQHREGSGG